MYGRNLLLFCVLQILGTITAQAALSATIVSMPSASTAPGGDATSSGSEFMMGTSATPTFNPGQSSATPTFNGPSSTSSSAPSSSASHTSTAAVVLATLGGVLGLLILFLLARMTLHIYRTPRVDRIMLIRTRNQVDAEMAQLQREQLEQRVHTILEEQAAPPAYEPSPSYSGAEDAKLEHADGFDEKADKTA